MLGVMAARDARRRCVRSSAASMRRPLRSRRPTISPTRPRSTASGLHMTRVRSTGGDPNAQARRTGNVTAPGRASPAIRPRRSGRPRRDRASPSPRRGPRTRQAPVPAPAPRRSSRTPRRQDRAACRVGHDLSGSWARGDCGRQATTRSRRSGPRAEMSCPLSRPRRQPMTTITRLAAAKSSVERPSGHRRAGRVVGPVEHDERTPAHHLEATRDPDRGESLTRSPPGRWSCRARPGPRRQPPAALSA